MKAAEPLPPRRHGWISRLPILLGFCMVALSVAGQNTEFSPVQRLTNRELLLRFSAPTGSAIRVYTATNLLDWQGFLTLRSTGQNQHVDSATPWLNHRFYNAEELTATNLVFGDHCPTTNGDVIIRPLNHATFVLQWNDFTIYNDPVAPTTLYTGLPKAGLILVSHNHGDHFYSPTIDFLRTSNTWVVVPANIFNSLSIGARARAIVLTNGASTNFAGLRVEAVAASNSFHPAGQGNGYVLTLGGRRFYMSGDTGDLSEIRALTGIDVAFVAMNIPYTMTTLQAANLVRAFRPKVVYPYHFENQDDTFSDLNDFKRRVGTDLGIEIRIRKWYPNQSIQ